MSADSTEVLTCDQERSKVFLGLGLVSDQRHPGSVIRNPGIQAIHHLEALGYDVQLIPKAAA